MARGKGRSRARWQRASRSGTGDLRRILSGVGHHVGYRGSHASQPVHPLARSRGSSGPEPPGSCPWRPGHDNSAREITFRSPTRRCEALFLTNAKSPAKRGGAYGASPARLKRTVNSATRRRGYLTRRAARNASPDNVFGGYLALNGIPVALDLGNARKPLDSFADATVELVQLAVRPKPPASFGRLESFARARLPMRR